MISNNRRNKEKEIKQLEEFFKNLNNQSYIQQPHQSVKISFDYINNDNNKRKIKNCNYSVRKNLDTNDKEKDKESTSSLIPPYATRNTETNSLENYNKNRFTTSSKIPRTTLLRSPISRQLPNKPKKKLDININKAKSAQITSSITEKEKPIDLFILYEEFKNNVSKEVFLFLTDINIYINIIILEYYTKTIIKER